MLDSFDLMDSEVYTIPHAKIQTTLMKLALPSLHMLYLMIALPIVLCMVFLTPPGQVPDEPHHLYRAVQILSGHFVASKNEQNQLGGAIPESIQTFVNMPTFEAMSAPQAHTTLAGAASPRIDATALFNAHLEQLQWGGTASFVDFKNTAIYPFLSYMPAILGLLIGKLLHLSILASFFLGRLSNAAISILCSTLAIQLTSRGKFLIFCLLLAPINLFIFASLSQDASIIGYSALAIGIINRLMDAPKTQKNSLSSVFVAQILLTAVALSKCVYLPFVFGLPCILFFQNNRLYKWAALFSILSTMIVLSWTLYSDHLLHGMELAPHVNSLTQLQYIIQQPITFLKAMLRGLVDHHFYLIELVGVLGWLQFILPPVFYFLFGIGALICLYANGSNNNLNLQSKGLLLILCVGSFVGISLVEYLAYTPVHAAAIEGIQGRYYIPIVLFISLILGQAKKITPVFWLACVFFIFVDLGTLYQIALRYYY